MEDVVHSDNGNVTESCENITPQNSEKKHEIANVIQKLKPTECN